MATINTNRMPAARRIATISGRARARRAPSWFDARRQRGFHRAQSVARSHCFECAHQGVEACFGHHDGDAIVLDVERPGRHGGRRSPSTRATPARSSAPRSGGVSRARPADSSASIRVAAKTSFARDRLEPRAIDVGLQRLPEQSPANSSATIAAPALAMRRSRGEARSHAAASDAGKSLLGSTGPPRLRLSPLRCSQRERNSHLGTARRVLMARVKCASG